MIGDPKVLSDPHLSKKRSRPKVSAMSALKPKISQKAIIMHQKVSQVGFRGLGVGLGGIR